MAGRQLNKGDQLSRQDVQEQTPDKVLGDKRHGLMPRQSLGPIVLPLEGDTKSVHGCQPAIADRVRDLCMIAASAAQDMPIERRTATVRDGLHLLQLA